MPKVKFICRLRGRVNRDIGYVYADLEDKAIVPVLKIFDMFQKSNAGKGVYFERSKCLSVLIQEEDLISEKPFSDHTVSQLLPPKGGSLSLTTVSS